MDAAEPSDPGELDVVALTSFLSRLDAVLCPSKLLSSIAPSGTVALSGNSSLNTLIYQ